MAEQKIEYSLELDVRNWARGIDAAISSLRSFEQSIDRAMKEVDSFESKLDQAFKSMPKLEDVNITVDAKLGTVDSGIDNLLNQDSVDVTVDASEGSIPSTISELLSDPSSTINVDANEGSIPSTIEELLSDPSAQINVDAKEGAVDSSIDDLLSGPSVNMFVDVKEGVMDGTIAMLLGANAAVELAVNLTAVGGGALGVAGGVLSFVIDPLIEADTAMARFEATTGQRVEGLAEKIENVYTGAWGESRDEVARVMAKLTSDLDVPADKLEDLTAQVFDVANVMDADFNEVLSAAAAMVDSGFAPSLESAFDGMVVGQQEGLNRAGDLLDTFREYSSTFNDMGFTMDDALTTMNSGLEAGIDNTDRIADAIREAGIRATTDFDTKKDFFEQIGMLDEAQAFADGEITGKEYMDGLFAALADVEDTSVRELIQDELLGTISEDFGAEALSALGDIREEIRLIGGEAKTAGETINNTMGTAWETIKRTFQSEVANYFNNELDFTGFMTRLKSSVSGFFEDLKSGEGFGESLMFNLAFATDETGFGDIVHQLIDALLLTAESVANSMVAVLTAIDAIPGVGVDVQGAKDVAEGVSTLRFQFGVSEVDDMSPEDFETWLVDNYAKGIGEKMTPVLFEGFQTALDQGASGLDALNILENIEIASDDESLLSTFRQVYGIDDTNFEELFSPLAQQAQQAAMDGLNAAISEGRLGEALSIAEGLGEQGLIGLPELERIKSQISSNFATVLQTGADDIDLEQLPNVFNDYLTMIEGDESAIQTAKANMGMTLDLLFADALAESDFATAGSIVDMIGDFTGEDTAMWENALQTAELQAASAAIQTDLQEVGTEGEASLGLVGAAASNLEMESRTAFGALTLNHSKMTSAIQADGLLIETAFTAIGLAWDALPETLRGALVNGFGTLPTLAPAGAGGSTNNTTINQNNTFNNQNGAASAGSGQAAANAIRV